MPALETIVVEKTDTFEEWRVKTNQLGTYAANVIEYGNSVSVGAISNFNLNLALS